MVVAVANDIVASVGRTLMIDGINVTVGCSVRLCCTDDACDAFELMQQSDVARYESKRNGLGRASCYRPGLLEAVVERQKLETDNTEFDCSQMNDQLPSTPIEAI
jgi:predicted signal transduction protein with EAL and GGDEF domain